MAESIGGAQGVFIGNEWRAAEGGGTIDVVAPAEGKPFARIAAGGKADIDAAVAAAREAVEGPWGRVTAADRGRLLHRLGRLVEDHAEELAALEARDTGKPMRQARADIAACARYYEYYGGAADKVHGNTIPLDGGFLALTERVSYGVVGIIIPWNYPAQMCGRTLGAALAMGNACVMKPAEDACLTPLRIAELVREAGFPAGAVNVVPGFGREAGAALAGHRGIDFLSFTGSPEVGVAVQQAAAANHVGCTLELGGKSPQIVFDDADLDAALPVIVGAIVQNAGQTCSAGSRLLVQRGVEERLVARLADRFASLRAGTPEQDLDLGPVINAKQKGRVERFLEAAAADGIATIAQGQVAAETGGTFVAPAILGPVPHANRLAQDEVFGPVLSVIPFDDAEEAVRLANGTEYGLTAGVWSRDVGRALGVARRIVAGQVYVNAYGAGGGIELPFGGMKKSGHGREKGWEGLHDFSTLRTLVVRHD